MGSEPEEEENIVANTSETRFVPAQIDMTKHHCKPENARLFLDWIANRGGLAIWQSVDLAWPGQSWTAPLKDEEGNLKPPPHWKCGGPSAKPKRIITDPADVLVVIDREVERFLVKLKFDGQGHIVLTKRSGDKVNRAKERFGEGSYHVFENGTTPHGLMYGDDTCIIMAPEKSISLAEFDCEAWEREHPTQEKK